jgi:hypothetical protein
MPGNIDGNHLLEVNSGLLSHCFEYLQTIQNEILSGRCLTWTLKSHTVPDHEYNVCYNSHICSLTKNTFTEIVVWETHCHNAKSTCLARDLAFNKCTAINVPKLRGWLFVLEEHIHSGQLLWYQKSRSALLALFWPWFWHFHFFSYRDWNFTLETGFLFLGCTGRLWYCHQLLIFPKVRSFQQYYWKV